jgi:prolyl-tRNA synthetase
MPDGKVIQQPSTHLLGQNFSKPFDINFQNEKGEKDYVWQTCYGPAISRMYASLISSLGDDKGLRFPFELAPIQIIIVPIYKEENKRNVLTYSKKIKKVLERDYRIKIDDSDNTPGYKFNEWEMKGVPIRLEIGGREVENNQITISLRTSKEKQSIKLIKLKKFIRIHAREITDTLRKEADENFKEVIHNADSLDKLKSALQKGGFVRVPFCSIDIKGKECADIIKAETSGDIRGTKVNDPERPRDEDKCICCGKPAKNIVYVAKQY